MDGIYALGIAGLAIFWIEYVIMRSLRRKGLRARDALLGIPGVCLGSALAGLSLMLMTSWLPLVARPEHGCIISTIPLYVAILEVLRVAKDGGSVRSSLWLDLITSKSRWLRGYGLVVWSWVVVYTMLWLLVKSLFEYGELTGVPRVF
jgi:hypothetical protein